MPQLLVVDDAPDSRALLSRLFRRREIDVVEAADGAAALSLIATSRFDAVLLDVSMPGVSGLDVLRAVRAKHTQASLPVVMVTGRNQTDDILVAFKLGANDYVTKPIDQPVLVARVLTQIGRKRAEERLESALGELSRTNFELQQESRRRAASEARAWDLAHHDPLTGVGNRLRFWEDLAVAIAATNSAEPLALLTLDLDGFKDVNDRLGHQVGDELLRIVSNRIRGCLRDGASVARLGGDEFAVLVPALLEPDEAQELAARLIEVITMPAMLEDHEVAVGCSIGIAIAASARTDAQVLFRQADTALYAAKSAGRATWRLFGEHSEAANGGFAMRSDTAPGHLGRMR